MDAEAVPLAAVPLLLQIVGQPDHEQRSETLAILCDLVSSCFGLDGEALGTSVRDSGGLLTLSWLLAEMDQDVVKQTLFIIANLASDAVDPYAYLTKQLLHRCGAEFRLLPCLDSEDDEVVAYACGGDLIASAWQRPAWTHGG